ncbi:DUF2975 domain-containing protein [Rhodohalobacter sp. 8-1]|uniref:DUF2975 domain-containing protein n=1 Tax=Rhodohalobacter sp. 8-1 TaxID=3131972 RepID=UPI0030EE49B1
MKLLNKFSILVWACNIIISVLMIGLIASVYYYSILPGIIDADIDSAGVKKSTYRISHSLLSDNFMFERVIDKEAGIDTSRYYFSSLRNLYLIPISDSLALPAQKINRDLSSESSRLGGIVTKSITVSEQTDPLPVRFAAPALPLEKERYIELARSNVLYFLIVLLLAILILGLLRQFIAGLRSPVFFTRINAIYLYCTAALTLIAPFFIWVWSAFLRPDLFSEYRFEGASPVNFTPDISLALLFFGVILLVIAWCFDQGVKLQQEQELTI